MPSTAHNRKHVYLSPKRADVVRKLVEAEIVRLVNLAPDVDANKQEERENMIALLKDCSRRLANQSLKPVQGNNGGKLLIDDYVEVLDLSDLDLGD